MTDTEKILTQIYENVYPEKLVETHTLITRLFRDHLNDIDQLGNELVVRKLIEAEVKE